MAEKYLRVTMPDGSKWDVPARLIAKNRAKYYADDPDTTYEDEFNFTMSDDYELKEWAANNMNWDDENLRLKRPSLRRSRIIKRVGSTGRRRLLKDKK